MLVSGTMDKILERINNLRKRNVIAADLLEKQYSRLCCESYSKFKVLQILCRDDAGNTVAIMSPAWKEIHEIQTLIINEVGTI